MKKLLEDLITTDTKILHLESDENISNESKLDILNLDSSLAYKYIKNMYYKNGVWYYFKEDKAECVYPYYIIDELIGSYLARKRNMPAVFYEIAEISGGYGLTSSNFKDDNHEYSTIIELIDMSIPLDNLIRLEALKTYTIDSKNETEFLKHLFNLFALDIHMLQKDRADVNLQFQQNKKSGYFDLAPLYDFSNCSSKVGMEGLNIPSKIVKLDYLSIISLAKKYKVFKDALELCIDELMADIWNQICFDYKFNMDTHTYENILNYYIQKDKCQQEYLKRLIKDIK